MEKSLQQMLEESKYTVVLSGFGMLLESGYPALRDGEESYEIEQKYGYSTEEIFHSSFYSTRKELFYEFYRNEMLETLKIPPGRGFYALAELQQMGMIQSIITRRIYALPRRAGCENVIELHGSICENYCSHCGKQYPVEAILNTKKVPLCTDCNMPIRPGVILYGEMVDNALITRAAAEVAKADMLLILGTNLKTYLCEQMIGYYQGNKMVLVTLNTHFSDKSADFVIHNRVDKTLEQVINGLKAKNIS